MKPPPMVGVVERRLLVNYRTDPEITARLVPAPLRPQQVNGWAVAGICLIRLGRLRPRHVPAVLGLRSENAAHRIAVEWDTPGGLATGVYIPRRDSGSLVNVVVGGRLFPGQHHRARFDSRETTEDLCVDFASADGTASAQVHVRTTDRWAGSRLFADLDEASTFFRHGSVGYSATSDGRCLDGLELRSRAWRVEPMEILAAESTFFDDTTRFPAGSAALDCALLMRHVPVTWEPLSSMPTLAAARGAHLDSAAQAGPARLSTRHRRCVWSRPRRHARVNSITQLNSQVFPSSGENSCSHRADVDVMSDQMKWARIGLPSWVSSP